MFVEKKIPFEKLTIDFHNIWAMSGNEGYEPDVEVRQILDSVIEEIREVCQPCYGYSIFCNESMGKRKIMLGGGQILHTGKIITRCLHDAEKYVIFVATAGREFEALQRKYRRKRDIVREFFVDVIGSEIAEAIGRILTRDLAEEQNCRGYNISNSYSPGYCGWPVTNQRVLFSLLPKKPCGITLTDSSLMIPIKSISGIIALGTNVKKEVYGCGICGKKNCYKKKYKNQINENNRLDKISD